MQVNLCCFILCLYYSMLSLVTVNIPIWIDGMNRWIVLQYAVSRDCEYSHMDRWKE
jgi:hypothetical protein